MIQREIYSWAVCISLCLMGPGAFARSNSPQSNPRLGQDQVVELLLEMQYAYAAQRSLLKTMQLNACVVRPQDVQIHDAQTCLTMDIRAFPGAKVISHLAFSGNSQGHSLQRIQTFNLGRQANPYARGLQDMSAHWLMFSFDGQQARILNQGQGFIYNHMEQVPNVGHYDPRRALPHLFNTSVMQMLDRPEQVQVVPVTPDLLLLTFSDDRILHLFYVLPEQDFMITKLMRISVSDGFPVTAWEQGIQYDQSSTGFWYPTRSYTKSHERVTQLAKIDSFVLNPPATSYSIGFSGETPVYRHQGQASYLSFHGQGQTPTRDPGAAQAPQVIAGHILDVNGSPVAGASIQVCGDSHLDDYDTVLWHGPRTEEQLLTCTDEQGHFRLILDMRKDYHLLVYDARYAPTLVRNIPINTQDLVVRLSPGGTITGRVVCIQEEARIPVPQVEIRAVQLDPCSLPLMRLDCDRIVLTDAQGRFQFDRLLVRVMDFKGGQVAHWDAKSHLWEIACLDCKTAITLSARNSAAELELVVKPQARQMFTRNILP